MFKLRSGINDIQQEAYRPLMEDGRGLFPEDFRVKAPRDGLSTHDARCSGLRRGLVEVA
jgi:hypothetical protein